MLFTEALLEQQIDSSAVTQNTRSARQQCKLSTERNEVEVRCARIQTQEIGMSLSMHGVRCFTKQQLKKEETQLVQKSKNETLMCMKMQISLNTSTILLQTI